MEVDKSMSEIYSQASGVWGSDQWVTNFKHRYGVPPIAGGDAAAGEPPAAAEGGEGGESQDNSLSGLYDLNEVPEALRPHVEQVAKQISGNVTKKFQEAADYKSGWEPYEQLGINEYDPESLQGLLAFAEIANDPEAFQEWWESVGDDQGFFDSGGDPEDNGNDLGELEEGSDEQRLAQVQQMLEGLVDQKLQPIQETLSEASEEALVEEASELIDEELTSLHDEHGDFDEEIVMQLAFAHAPSPDAVQQGFADYQRLVNNVATSTIEGKANQPRPGEGSGAADTNRQMPTSFDEAAAMAKERYSNAS